MKNITRVIMFIASIILVGIYFLPIWNISLEAPQFPEGLGLYINVSSIEGHKENDLNSINNLNHYIGMKKIIPDSIPELKIMPFIIAFFIALGLITSYINKKWLIITWVFLLLIVSFVGIYDFYLWGYDYGHNLDPKAIIKIPGQSYQPPVIGTKQLLNFTAHSFPAAGGILLGISLVLGIAAIFLIKKTKPKSNNLSLMLFPLPLLFLVSCNPEPKPIEFGFDNCHKCGMTIADERWGAEIVTHKGKVYKFDAVECMVAYYLDEKKFNRDNEIHSFWTINYLQPKELIDATTAYYLKSTEYQSPMAFNAPSFKTREERDKSIKTEKDIPMDWIALVELIKKEWMD